MQGGDHKLAFAAQDVCRVMVISVIRLHDGHSIGCTLLQFGHHTFGKRFVSSSIAQNLGTCPTA